MAARLEQLAREANPLKNPFLNRRASQLFGQQLAELLASSPTNRAPAVTSLRYRYALELLNAGETRPSLREFEALQAHLSASGQQLSPKQEDLIREAIIVAWLRLGEQDNCQARHNPYSCLLPIAPEGTHLERQGSEQAARLLLEELRHGRSPKYAWLLNLAHMTLGTWPEAVPASLRIPPSVFASTHDLKRFPDVAGPLGLDLNDLAGSVVADDFDNDHDLDLVICSWGLRDPLRYFVNLGDGRFEERSEAAGLGGLVGGLNLVQADYDNDGWLDFLVLRGAWFGSEGRHPNSLVRNRGDGTFEDATERAGLLSFHPTQTATWLDFDGDGWLDLFIGNESTEGDRHPAELFRSNRDGTFTEMASKAGVDVVGLVKSVHSGDFNNDGRPDLYVSCQDRENFLLRNDGPADGGWKFTDIAKAAGVDQPASSFPAWFFDYDQDGRLDLYVSSYFLADPGLVAADYLRLPHGAATQRLYRGNGDGTFEDVTEGAGLARVPLPMSANFGDLDNDGWPDFYLGTGTPSLAMLIPNRMYRNDRGRRFQDVTTSGGFGHVQKGHGIAFADLDHDGDQDVYVCLGGAYEGDFYRNALFENPGHGNRWLKLRLIGVRSNRAAIGARIRVDLETPEGPRSVWRDVNSGATFGGSPLRQEIGLGQATAIRKVEVWWPATGVRQAVKGCEPNGAYLVREDRTEAERIDLRPFPISSPQPKAGAR